jgi:hypothetical protein
MRATRHTQLIMFDFIILIITDDLNTRLLTPRYRILIKQFTVTQMAMKLSVIYNLTLHS